MTNTMSIRSHSRQDEVRSAPAAAQNQTTPAEEGESLALSGVALLSVMLGAWLLICHYVLGYPFTEGAEDAFFNEVLAGVVLLSTGYGRLRSPWHLPKLTAMQATVGGWLIAAPWAVGYGADVPVAQANDVGCGLAAVMLAMAGELFSRLGARVPARSVPTVRGALPRQAAAPRERAYRPTVIDQGGADRENPTGTRHKTTVSS